MEVVLLALAGIVLLATLAPKLPVLYRLPKVGAPSVQLRVTIDDQQDLVVADPSAVVLRIAIFNGGSTELERARLNVLVPAPTEILAADAFGQPQGRGSPMPPTKEQLVPGRDSNFWFERNEFDPGWTPVHYLLNFREPGTYPIRIKLVSKSMYRPVQEDHRIQVLCSGARSQSEAEHPWR
ncbi:MAG TPA: hypothetical protein VL988_05200 [Solirubrobacteraceae bacterium]|nr:hypothetical protein [Solirubrobacteraceae bacterium]